MSVTTRSWMICPARSRFGSFRSSALALLLTLVATLLSGRVFANQIMTDIGQISERSAEQALPAKLASIIPPSASEPFGRLGSEVIDGPLVEKWRSVQRAIALEMNIITSCRTAAASCSSPAAIEFLAIVERARARDGLARAGEINRAINLDIRPVSDLQQYQIEDVWNSPLATLTSRAGDCEDYAVAKLTALREAGVASENLRLVILRNKQSGEDHAVVAIRVEKNWRVLDSRRFLMLEDTQFKQFQPIFAIDETGIKRYENDSQISASAAPAHSAGLTLVASAREAAE